MKEEKKKKMKRELGRGGGKELNIMFLDHWQRLKHSTLHSAHISSERNEKGC